MAGKVQVVVGAQYGSEGKGAVCAHLSRKESNGLMAMRVAGPNAGHTVIGNGPDGAGGYAWKLRAVPVAAVTCPDARLAIAAGSEVDLEVLKSEVDALDAAGYAVSDRLMVDRHATILDPAVHIQAEAASNLTERLGSTGKGIGAARVERLMRTASTYGGDVEVAEEAHDFLARGGTVQIEGTQGYGLGLHTDAYPFTTSSDCRAIDFLAMAGVCPWDWAVGSLEIWAVARTTPIRVAGNSGPLANETSWEELGLPIERTTVTNKVRRVGRFDPTLVRRAVAANGGPTTVRVALTMGDHLWPGIAGKTRWIDCGPEASEALLGISRIEEEIGARVALVGTGPDTMIDRRPMA